MRDLPNKFKDHFTNWKNYFVERAVVTPITKLDFGGEDKNLRAFDNKDRFINWYCDHPETEAPYKDFGFIMREFTWISNYFKPKNIVELGTYFGASVFFLNMLNPQVDTITSVDTQKIQKYGEVTVETGHIAKINNVLYTQIIGDSALSIVPTPFDFCFIDGDHSGDGVWKDSLWAWENKGSRFVILWHDCHTDRPEFKGLLESINMFSNHINMDIYKFVDSATAWVIVD